MNAYFLYRYHLVTVAGETANVGRTNLHCNEVN